MEKDRKIKIDATLFDLCLGIFLYGIVCQIVILFFSRKPEYSIGLWIGVVLAAIATDPLVSAVMKLAGISSFSAHPNLIEAVCPAVIVVLTFLAFAWLYAGKIRRVPLSVLVSE